MYAHAFWGIIRGTVEPMMIYSNTYFTYELQVVGSYFEF